MTGDNVEFSGRLYISGAGTSKPWGCLDVPQAVVDGVFKAMSEPGVERPEYPAHISVFTADELGKIGVDNIKERGRSFKFTISGIKSIRPTRRNTGYSRVFMLICRSPELEALRKSYGLTPLLYGSHRFHVTIGTKAAKSAIYNGVVKSAGNRRALAALGLGGLGALGGWMMPDKEIQQYRPETPEEAEEIRRKAKQRRIARMLAGGALGGIAGYGLGGLKARTAGQTPSAPEAAPAASEVASVASSTVPVEPVTTDIEQLSTGGSAAAPAVSTAELQTLADARASEYPHGVVGRLMDPYAAVPELLHTLQRNPVGALAGYVPGAVTAQLAYDYMTGMGDGTTPAGVDAATGKSYVWDAVAGGTAAGLANESRKAYKDWQTARALLMLRPGGPLSHAGRFSDRLRRVFTSGKTVGRLKKYGPGLTLGTAGASAGADAVRAAWHPEGFEGYAREVAGPYVEARARGALRPSTDSSIAANLGKMLLTPLGGFVDPIGTGRDITSSIIATRDIPEIARSAGPRTTNREKAMDPFNYAIVKAVRALKSGDSAGLNAAHDAMRMMLADERANQHPLRRMLDFEKRRERADMLRRLAVAQRQAGMEFK